MIYFDWRPYLRLILVGAGLLVLYFLIWPAKAQPVAKRCGSYDAIIAALELKYNEVIKSEARVNDRVVLHVFVSLEGSWTLITKATNNYACIVLTGDTWEDVLFEPGQRS